MSVDLDLYTGTSNTPVAHSGSNAVNANGPVSSTFVFQPIIPITPGTQYKIIATLKSANGTPIATGLSQNDFTLSPSSAVTNDQPVINQFISPQAPTNAIPSTILTWSASNASGCVISGPGFSGTTQQGVQGAVSTGNITTTNTYTLTCSNSSGGSASQSITVTVPNAITITSPQENAVWQTGQTYTISWLGGPATEIILNSENADGSMDQNRPGVVVTYSGTTLVGNSFNYTVAPPAAPGYYSLEVVNGTLGTRDVVNQIEVQ